MPARIVAVGPLLLDPAVAALDDDLGVLSAPSIANAEAIAAGAPVMSKLTFTANGEACRALSCQDLRRL